MIAKSAESTSLSIWRYAPATTVFPVGFESQSAARSILRLSWRLGKEHLAVQNESATFSGDDQS